MRLIAKAMIRT